MRSPLLVLALTTAMSAALGAQESPKPARFGIAVGPAWAPYATGFHLRAEYAVVQQRRLELQVYAGGLWTPTQSYSTPSVLYGDGSRFVGTNQIMRLHVGMVGIIMPWRGRISPYLVAGIAAVQSWSQGVGGYYNPDGSLAEPVPPGSETRGDVVSISGIGLRLRVGDRPIQLELRRYYGGRGQMHDLTLGTALPF